LGFGPVLHFVTSTGPSLHPDHRRGPAPKRAGPRRVSVGSPPV